MPAHSLSLLINQPARLLPQSGKDAALGDEHGIGGEVQFLRHFGRRCAVEGDTFKRSPGRRFEFAPQPREQLLRDEAVVFQIPSLRQAAVGIGQLIEQVLNFSPAGFMCESSICQSVGTPAA